MPDNWGYVLAAYGVAVVVLTAYWRSLVRRDRALSALGDRRARPAGTGQRQAAAPADRRPGPGARSRTT